jgi:hypothetical protein
MRVGIACSAGSYKGVFVHGVLAALGEANFEADIYAAASSTAPAAAYAAVGDLATLHGPEHWIRMYDNYQKNNYDISKVIIDTIPQYTEHLLPVLFKSGAKRFGIAVSAVTTREAAELTQGPGARRLGQRLVLATRNRDRSWADENLQTRLFQSGLPDAPFKLTPGNLHEVFYATTRMLHAWKRPAWIDGQPYVDASYTCLCPAIELAEIGCTEIVAISPEEGHLYRDFFQSSEIPSSLSNASIHVIKPRRSLVELGVDYMKATSSGLAAAYELGREAGSEFLESGAIACVR